MYSASANPFALLAQDDDKPQKPQAAAKTTKAPAPTVVGGAESQNNGAPLKNKQRDQNRQVPTTAAKPQQSRPNNKSGPLETATSTTFTADERQGGQAASSGRSRRGGRGGWQGHGRVLDRQSASGIRDTEKSVSQAWGHPIEDDLLAGEAVAEPSSWDSEVAATAVQEPNASNWAELQSSAPVVPDVPVKVVEPPTKTLEEYLAEKAALKLLKKELPQLRKANEGTDGKEWQNAIPVTRKEPASFYEAKSGPARKKKDKEPKSKHQPILINQQFSNTSRPNPRNPSAAPPFNAVSDQGNRNRQPRSSTSHRSQGDRNSAPSAKDDAAFPILA